MYCPVLPDAAMTFVGPVFNIPYGEGKSLAVQILTGSSSGYQSCISRLVENDFCTIVLSNITLDDISRIADDIGDIVLRRYLGIAAGAEAPLTRDLPAPTPVDPSSISKILGFYSGRKGVFTGVVQDDHGLFYIDFTKQDGIRSAWPLTPVGGDTFQLTHNPQFRCVFSSGSDGAIVRLSASRNGRTFNQAEKYHPEGFDVSDRAGSYTSLELQKTFRFDADQNVLMAENFLEDARTRFLPLEKNLFGFSRGFLRFSRDKTGSLTGCNVFTKDTDRMFGSKCVKIVY